MKHRSLFVRIGLALAVAGCASGEPPVVDMSAVLNATQEVPPTTSPATGQGRIAYDRETRQLTWNIDYAGLTGGPLQAAHFHGPAAQGANAGVQVPIAVGPSPLKGAAMLTEAQAEQLLDGRLYVNLHTAAFPAGEIRGQVVRAATSTSSSRDPVPYIVPEPPPQMGTPTIRRY